MTFIKAKFESFCYETGQRIKKGDLVLYCSNLKKVFHYNSPSAIDFERQQEEKHLASQEPTLLQNSGWILLNWP